MLLYLAIALQLSSAVAAVLLAWRRADHRPFAAWSVGTTVATLTRVTLAATVLPMRAPGLPPFVGAQRVVFHVDEALFLSSGAGLAVVTIWLFAKRRTLALLPALAWVGVVAYLATHYPEVRADALRKVYLAAQLAAISLGRTGADDNTPRSAAGRSRRPPRANRGDSGALRISAPRATPGRGCRRSAR